MSYKYDTPKHFCYQILHISIVQFERFLIFTKRCQISYLLHAHCAYVVNDILVLWNLERSRQTPNVGYHVDERRRRTNAGDS